MNLFYSWLLELDDYSSLFLLAKITLLLLLVWTIHVAVAKQNPRWRVLLWRSAAVGIVLLFAQVFCPPLISWSVLPEKIVKTKMELPNTVANTSTEKTDSNELQQPTAAFPRQPQPIDPMENSKVDRSDKTNPDPRQTKTPSPPQTELNATPENHNSQPSTARIIANEPQRTKHTLGSEHFWKSPKLLWWLVGIWSVGFLFLLLRTCIGAMRLARIRRDTKCVPDSVVTQASAIAKNLGWNRQLNFRQSDEVESPCLIGLPKPMILLPKRQCELEHKEELPAILAHEIAHLKAGDHLWNTLIHAIAMLFWFHPLLWLVRLVHANACDSVSDAVAADYLGDVEKYTQTLARIAVRIASPSTAINLAMARSSNIRKRIETLKHRVFGLRLARRKVLAFLAMGAISATTLGGIALTRSIAETVDPPLQKKTEIDSNTTPKKNATSEMKITAVSKETGKPIVNLRIRFRGTVNGKRFDETIHTDRKGIAILEWTKRVKSGYLRMHGSKQGFVPINFTWSDDQRAIELPEALELKIEAGELLGGVVRDVNNNPIKGAKVDITIPSTWPQKDSMNYYFATLTTDKEGKWRTPNAPTNLSGVRITFSHADYFRKGSMASKGVDNVVVLKQGLEVKGRVLNSKGKPVIGAVVRNGFDIHGTFKPKTTTDEDGHFVLKNCREGRTLVTVQADGFSPQMQEVRVLQQMNNLQFQLEKAHTLRIRVVDTKGNPLEGVRLSADTWNGYRSLEFRTETDAEGRAEWRNAPENVVLFGVFKVGFMTISKKPLKASSKRLVVKMFPELVIQGRVTDAATGEPIPKFDIRRGYYSSRTEGIYWYPHERTSYTAGKYRFKFTHPREGHAIQVMAPGYRWTASRRFESTEGTQTFDFKLEPARKIEGIVVLPNGKPIKDVEIAIADRQNRAKMKNGRFDKNQNKAKIVRTDAEGSFGFITPKTKNYFLIAIHEKGFAEVSCEDFEKSKRIELELWGRLEGRSLVGNVPDVAREIAFRTRRPSPARNSWSLMIDSQTTTDADGRFRFDRVVPGPGFLSRIVVTKYPRGLMQSPSAHKAMVITEGKTISATIGGAGRPVTGQIKLDRKPEFVIDWTTNDPVSISPIKDPKTKSDRSPVRYLANIDKTGRFSVTDVPSGDYRLFVGVNYPPAPQNVGSGEVIGRFSQTFSIPWFPAGRSDKPFDLGEVVVKLDDMINPGDLAPDFHIQNLRGEKALRLSDLRGKLVFLNFWSIWSDESKSSMSNLKDIQKEFGKNPRFKTVSLSCDNNVESARKFAVQEGYNWMVGFAGHYRFGIGKKYTVYRIPWNYLIGPDGRILAKNLKDEELKQALSKALKDEELFRKKPVAPESPYPVERFKNTEKPKPIRSKPAVIAMIDSGRTLGKIKPETDRLSFLNNNGKELWARSHYSVSSWLGAGDRVALDRTRKRIYVLENAAHRLTAYDNNMQKIWQVKKIKANTLAIDEKTGNVWCSGGSNVAQGITVVFDRNGQYLAAHPYHAFDIAYDSFSDAFWLVGSQIVKLNREGKVLSRVDFKGWCCTSVSVNPKDGTVWITESDSASDTNSRNRIWILNSDGKERHKIDLGDITPFVVECGLKSGAAWLSSASDGLHLISIEGKLRKFAEVKARGLSISPTTGDIWVSTTEEIIRLNSEGKVLNRTSLGKESFSVWLLAY